MTVASTRDNEADVGGDDGTGPARGRRIDLLLVAVILLLTAPVAQHWTDQPASRYPLTMAIVDDHTIRLDAYADHVGLDHAFFEGHLYSDKAPYQPFLAAPFYQLYRWAGGDQLPTEDGVTDPGAGTNYGLWWVTLWSSTIPAAALAVVVRRTVARVYPGVATYVALGLTLGTLVLPFATQLFAHVLSALVVSATWALLRDRTVATGAAFVAGLMTGLGIGIEYSIAAFAAIFALSLLLRRQVHAAVAYSLGTALAALPILLYNVAVYGNPFTVSYAGHMPHFRGEGTAGIYNIQAPEIEQFVRVLAGDRGVLILTPIVLCAVVGAVIAVARRLPTAVDGWVSLSTFAVMVLFSSGITAYGHSSPGPRYLVPVLPLFALPLAESWRRRPGLCSASALFGGFFMLLATITVPLIGQDNHNAPRRWVEMLLEGVRAPTVLDRLAPSWTIYATTLVGLAALVVLLRVERADERFRSSASAGRSDRLLGAPGTTRT